MIRALGMMGLGGGFLLISPAFRASVVNGLGSAVTTLNHYSPFSYVGLAIVVFGGAALSLYSPPRPH